MLHPAGQVAYGHVAPEESAYQAIRREIPGLTGWVSWPGAHEQAAQYPTRRDLPPDQARESLLANVWSEA
jgi:hypothetical protein